MVEASGGQIAQVAREMRLQDSSVGNAGRPDQPSRPSSGLTYGETPLTRKAPSEMT